jgi:versiconal hemiacetal acetate esterase
VPDKYKTEYTSYGENGENVPAIDKTSMDQFFELTGVDPEDKDYFIGNDPESHKLLPPTYVCTCEFDPLRDDGKVLVKSLEQAGVPVKYDHYDGLPHCFWYFPKLPETAVLICNTFAGINWAIQKM